MKLQHKAFETTEFKVLDDEKGIFEAYVSVFDVVDHAGERVKAGFFKKSLEQRLPKVVFAHDWNRPIGKTLPGTEERHAGDQRLPESLKKYGGLYCLGQLNLDVQDARDTFSHLKFGSLDEFSFGFTVTNATNAKDGVRDLLEGMTYEVSPVLVGCNPATQLVGVKAFRDDLPSLSPDELVAKSDELFAATIPGILFADDGRPLMQRISDIDTAVREFHELSLASFRDWLVDADDDEISQAEARYKDVFSVPARTAGRFENQLLALLTEAEGAITRADTIANLRESQGRSLFSKERRDQLASVTEAFSRLVERTAPRPDPLDPHLLQMKARARRRLLAVASGAPL